MRITDKTKYALFEPVEKYLTDEGVANLKRAAEQKFGTMYDLPFGTFYNCAQGDFSHLGDLTKPTVLQVYWCKRFADFATEFANTLQAVTLKPTTDEQRASQGLMKTDWGENMLVFLQQWFGCRSYKEAEQITIGELIIAKRAQYNQDKYRRQLAKIQTEKYKRK